MENERLIPLETVCHQYRIEASFIRSLSEYGLIEIIHFDETDCIDRDYLGEIEKMMNLHYELNINMEGIDAISHLLKRVKEMQKELVTLRNRLGNL